MRAFLFYLSLAGLASCSAKELVLEAPIISMTKKDTSRDVELVPGKKVSSKWCVGDLPVIENEDPKASYGLIDQALLLAHRRYETDYLVNARVFQKGGCAFVEARSAEVKRVKEKARNF